jgi:Zn-dependent metalloprotease
MYSKDEASQIKQAFWTTFGQYIAPQLSADGLKVNWVNYKTGIKHLYFKMDADKSSASIGINITHPDAGIQELFFEQFLEIKSMFNSYLNEDWNWVLHDKDENGKTISRIYKQLNGVSIYNRDHWPQLISFFKPRIIALGEFWSVGQYSFEGLK